MSARPAGDGAAPPAPEPPSRGERWVGHFADAIAGWPFPAWLLSILAFGTLAMLAMLLAPRGPSGFGAFAEEFQVWCFGFDPATGRMQPATVVVALVQPAVLSAVIWAFWAGPLRSAWRDRRPRLVAVGLVGVLSVAGAGAGMASLRVSDPTAELAFPADVLRLDHPAPTFRLIDQAGEAVSPADLRGKIVVLTAVYGHCGLTCPTIFRQARRSLAGLSAAERAEVVVLAVTLDPARDTPAALPRLAAAQKVAAPQWRLLSGPPAEVEAVLDAMEVARQRDPKTGVIDHANVFLLLDRRGRLAYRLTIGDRQQRWMDAALRVLLNEPTP
jgi:protein SCO1/2